eukprot:6213600-Pleurochrysis_carterae.AAC.3
MSIASLLLASLILTMVSALGTRLKVDRMLAYTRNFATPTYERHLNSIQIAHLLRLSRLLTRFSFFRCLADPVDGIPR